MLTLLLGPDSFSKKEFISSLASKEKAEVEFFINKDSAPRLDSLREQDLFAGKKIFVLQGLFGEYDWEEQVISGLAGSANYIVLEEDKLDKRGVAAKKILASKQVNIVEFILPHGRELDDWIVKRFAFYGVSVPSRIAVLLAEKLGRENAVETKFGGKIVDVKEVYDLWQVDSEIKKLIAYSGGTPIAEQDVHNLVFGNTDVDIFQIINAIADNNRVQVLTSVSNFLGPDGDDKTRIIQLNALLGEQFRNIVIIQDLVDRGTGDNQIIEKTGWKSGRLFILKKAASRFSAVKAKDFLNKLDHFDNELKSSSTPPRVLLDLILAQLLS